MEEVTLTVDDIAEEDAFAGLDLLLDHSDADKYVETQMSVPIWTGALSMDNAPKGRNAKKRRVVGEDDQGHSHYSGAGQWAMGSGARDATDTDTAHAISGTDTEPAMDSDQSSNNTRKSRNNVRNRQRVAIVKETVDELREELERQGALEPVAPEIIAAGGRRLEMAMPKTKVLSKALQQLVDLRAENERLRRLALTRSVTPLCHVVPPPDVSYPSPSQTDFVSWAFQHSSIPAFITYWGDGTLRIKACNRSFRELLGLLPDATGESCILANGGPVSWNDIAHPDHTLDLATVQKYADLMLAKEETFQPWSGVCAASASWSVAEAKSKPFRNLRARQESRLGRCWDVDALGGGGGGGEGGKLESISTRGDLGEENAGVAGSLGSGIDEASSDGIEPVNVENGCCDVGEDDSPCQSQSGEHASSVDDHFVMCMADFKIAQVVRDCGGRRRATAVYINLLPTGAPAGIGGCVV